MVSPIYTRDQAKARARSIRAELQSENIHVNHSTALERVAKEQGYDNWNTLSACLSIQPEVPVQVGDRVAGAYLKQPFVGTIYAVRSCNKGRTFKVSIEFDEPVDVVQFESFTNLRKRINAEISQGRTSYAKTGDGVPHLVIAKVMADSS